MEEVKSPPPSPGANSTVYTGISKLILCIPKPGALVGFIKAPFVNGKYNNYFIYSFAKGYIKTPSAELHPEGSVGLFPKTLLPAMVWIELPDK